MRRTSHLIKKVIYKIKYICAIFLIRCSVYADSPRCTARVLTLIAGTINTRGAYRVLCIGRTIFLDDVKAMAKFSGRIQYSVIHKIFFGLIFSQFTRAAEREKITENNYHTHMYCAEGKIKYNRYLTRMLPWLQKFLGFDAMLSGNFAYIAQEEIASVCHILGIPFIVLHKEAFDVDRDFVHKYRGCKFIGAKMLLYNKRVKDALLYSEARVGGVSDDILEVVGVPRLDSHFSLRHTTLADPHIVFFSFYPHDYFPSGEKGEEAKMRQARKRTDAVHTWVMGFALRHPQRRVVIKTKFAAHYLQYVKSILQDNFTQPIPNLVITNSLSPFDLIKDSSVVVGYSSMVLIEALIANRIVVSPYFADIIHNDGLETFFQKYPDFINYVQTEGEFNDRVGDLTQRATYDTEKRNAFLAELIFTPDGQASTRAEDAIIKTIKNFRNEK